MKTCTNCKYFEQCGDETRIEPCNGKELKTNPNGMEIAIECYNDIMFTICCEYNTIGTRFSENTENWNIRDMVAECDYWLSCYFEEGHCRCEMREEDYDAWFKETKVLMKFIEDYKPFIMNVKCHEGHCSQYDN